VHSHRNAFVHYNHGRVTILHSYRCVDPGDLFHAEAFPYGKRVARASRIINKTLKGYLQLPRRNGRGRVAERSYYTKYYRMGIGRGGQPVGPLLRSALIFGANEICRATLPLPPPPHSSRRHPCIIRENPSHPPAHPRFARFAPTPFHLYSLRIIDCPGHRFVHVQCAPRRHKRARARARSLARSR